MVFCFLIASHCVVYCTILYRVAYRRDREVLCALVSGIGREEEDLEENEKRQEPSRLYVHQGDCTRLDGFHIIERQ